MSTVASSSSGAPSHAPTTTSVASPGTSIARCHRRPAEQPDRPVAGRRPSQAHASRPSAGCQLAPPLTDTSTAAMTPIAAAAVPLTVPACRGQPLAGGGLADRRRRRCAGDGLLGDDQVRVQGAGPEAHIGEQVDHRLAHRRIRGACGEALDIVIGVETAGPLDRPRAEHERPARDGRASDDASRCRRSRRCPGPAGCSCAPMGRVAPPAPLRIPVLRRRESRINPGGRWPLSASPSHS